MKTNCVKPKLAPKPKNPLIGKFFHTFTHQGDHKQLHYQGYVIGKPESGFYLVQYFSYLDGSPSNQELVPFHKMKDWFFYSDADQMTYSYDHGAARRFRTYLDGKGIRQTY